MKSTVLALAAIASLFATAAHAEGCVYAGKKYSDGAVVNGKVCDGRAGVWR